MASAQHVSRLLREAGSRPVPNHVRSREGFRVGKSILGQVMVSADWDGEGKSARQSGEAEELLSGHGFKIDRASPSLFYVSKEG